MHIAHVVQIVMAVFGVALMWGALHFAHDPLGPGDGSMVHGYLCLVAFLAGLVLVAVGVLWAILAWLL